MFISVEFSILDLFDLLYSRLKMISGGDKSKKATAACLFDTARDWMHINLL